MVLRRMLRLSLLLPLLLVFPGCLNIGNDNQGTNAAEDSYLFCFWNVENLFDDHADDRTNSADREYDAWFAHDAKARKLKYDHIAEALVRMNNKRGPDVIALAEVETPRAAELLQENLNQRLEESLRYKYVLIKEAHGGRNINTAILTRLPVERDRTRLLGKRLRILEGHLKVNGHELVVIASHWTSRVTDEGGEGRDKYASQIYGEFRAMVKSNPKVDLLICGDFNDPPDEESVVKHLHATGDRDAVRSAAEPLLLDLMAEKSARDFGTHYHKGWFIFDQIVVSPGLLDDEGWTCDPDSVKTMNEYTADANGHPKPFGNEKHGERGYSDHFPVTVRLKVQGN